MRHIRQSFLLVLVALVLLAAGGGPPVAFLLAAAGAAAGAQETDTDGDTMPDAWEMFFGLDENDPGDAAGDLDGDGLTNAQEFAAGRHPNGEHMRYFAEGSTGYFDTSVGVLNLSETETAHVAIALLNQAGGVVSHRFTLGPRARRTVSINEVLGISAAVAIVVESDVPVAADRFMTWGTSGIGASLDSGAPAPATTWYFAEGATGPFLLYYLFQNPGMTPATVTIRYLVEGAPPVTTTHTLPPQSRTTVAVNQDDPSLAVASVGSVITSTAPIFAERAMYVNAGGTLGGGSASAGSNQLSTQWYFGEGSTGPFFQCFLSMLNPGATAATATVTYHMSDGSTASKAYPVPAGGRRTVYFNGEAASDPALAALATGPVWFTVSSTQPILGERAMWWFQWPWYEGHSAPGNTTSALSWAVPEGRDGGATREQTYVLIGNTTTTPGQVRLTLIPDTGAASTRDMAIAAGQRLTVNIGNLFGLTEGRFSVLVDSLGTPAVPLAVDYARYRSVNGVPFSGGGAAPAVPVIGDAAPSVTTTTPAANATGVAVDANLTVTFSEPVNAGAGAFVLQCPTGTPVTLTTLTVSPATTFTLEPATDLPISTACTLRIVASQVTDVDTTDPPDAMAADVVVPFTTSACATITVSPATVPGGTVNQPYGPVTFTQTGGTAPITWSLTAGTLPGGMSLSAAGVLAGTPTASGSFAFTVTATDTNSCMGSAPRTLSILSGPNQEPSFTAGPDQTSLEDAGPQAVAWATGISPGASPDETGQVVTFNVTGNNPALFSIAPAISPAGVLTYTAAPNANGTATITVELQDNGGTAGGGDDTSAPQTFTITITAVNDAPSFVKGTDPIAVVEDSGLTTLIGWATGISAGPADEAGQVLTFTLTGNTNAALFAVLPALDPATGTLTFTLQPDVAGTTTLTWTLSDNGGGANTSAPQTVVIDVGAINDPPAAVDDAYTTDEDTVLTLPLPGVLANDIDPDLVDTRVVVAVDGDPALVGVNFFSGKGGVLVNADGSFLYDPTSQNIFAPLAPGQSDTDTFTYTMRDAGGLISDATVTMTVTGVNDAPAIDLDVDDDGGTPPTTGTDFAIPFTEGSPPQLIQDEVDALIFDFDSPTLTTLTVTITNVLDALQEALDVDLVTGGFDATFTKSFDETTTPGVAVLTLTAPTPQPIASFNTLLRRVTYQNLDADPDVSAPRTITFVASDGAATGAPATTTVTIQETNSPPTADDDAYTVAEGGTLTIPAPGVLDGDVDPEGDAPITAVLVTGPANASAFTLNADGSFAYTHNGSETTTDTFTYQAVAGGLSSATATVTITITTVNDPPTAVDDANTTTEDAPVTASAPGVLANDTDPDPGDTRTVVSVNGVPGNVGVATATAGGGTVTLNANGSYTYNPGTAFQSLGAGQNGTDTFTYTLQDAAGAPSNVATVTITVTGLNDAPVVTAGAGAAAFTEDGPAVAVAPALTVTDADDTNLESATVQITTNYQNGQDVLAFTTQAGISGVFTAATGTLTLTGTSSVANYQLALQSVTYTNASQNPSTLARTVQFQVNDGTVNSNASTRTVTVAAVNDAPVVTAGTTFTFTEGDAATPIAATLTATDADDTNLESATVQITGNYQNGQDVLAFTNQAGITGVFNAATGTLTLTGTASVANYQTALRTVTYFNGSNNPSQLTRTVTFVVNDGDVSSAGAASTITVVAVNDAPLVVNETFELLGNTELRVDMTAGTTPHTSETTSGATPVEGVLDNDSDPEGDPFAITAVTGCTDPDGVLPFDCTLPGGAVLHIAVNGEFSYTPAPGATSGSFTYTVADVPSQGLPASVSGTVTFTFFDMIWYVDADAAAGGTGTSRLPFNTFTAATLSGAAGTGDLDDADDYIFLHGASAVITTGIGLEANQHLIGEPAGLVINRVLNGNAAPVTLVPANAAQRPFINGGAGSAVAIGAAVATEVTGLALGSTINAIDLTTASALSGAGTLTISNNVVDSAGAEGIDVNLSVGTTGTLALAIIGNTWNAANAHVGNAVDISRAAGTLSVAFSNNTNIRSNAAAVVIDGGAVANTVITSFANNSVHLGTLGAGVAIANVTFDGDLATGGIQQVNGGTLAVGVTGDAVGTTGVTLTSVQGSLLFTDLDAFGGSSGLTASGTGTGLTLAVTPASSGGSSTINAANGPAVDVSTAAINLQLASLTSNTSAAGVALASVTGTFSAATGSITKSSGAGTAFSVSGSNVAVAYAGSLNVTSGAGVSLTGNNAAATFTFSGGMTLTTGANTAFTATGGGTVAVCDENPCNPAATGALVNSITTTTATALNVANTTIGANNLEFRSVSSNGGSSTGIIVDTTGSTGGLKIKGSGTAASGGIIANKTGGDGSTTTGIGIYLSNTASVSIDRMQLNDFDNYAIRGLVVNGFALNNSIVNAATGTNGTSVAVDEGSVSFGVRNGTNGLIGTASVTNTTLEDGVEDTFSVFNTSGTLTLTMDNISVSGSGNDGVVSQGFATATVNIEVRNSDFSANFGDHFNATADGSANLNVQFGNNGANTLTGGGAGALGQSVTLQTGVAWAGSGTAFVSNNSINGAIDTPININIGGTGTFSATVNNNTIGTSGVVGSGTVGNKDAIRIIANGDGCCNATPNGGTFTAAVTNNTIQQVSGRGIYALARDGGTAGDPIRLNLTFTGNVLRESPSSGGQGIRVEAGATSTDDVIVHANIGGAGAAANTFQDDWGTNLPAGIDFDEIRITHGFSAISQFILTGLGANTSSTATVATYLAGRNTLPGGGAGVASATLAGGGVYETGGTPPVP